MNFNNTKSLFVINPQKVFSYVVAAAVAAVVAAAIAIFVDVVIVKAHKRKNICFIDDV